METYTGFKAIERMKTNWITPNSNNGSAYKYNEGEIWMMCGGLAGPCNITINSFFDDEFVDYEEPLQMEDWVTSLKHTFKIKGKYTKDGLDFTITDFYSSGCYQHYPFECLRKATPEEIEKEKRRRMFENAGRELNEFKVGDCVKDDNDSYMKVEDVISDLKIVLCSYYDSNACAIVRGRFKSVELIPVFFVENIVQVED